MTPFKTAYERAKYDTSTTETKYPLNESVATANADDDVHGDAGHNVVANGDPGLASTLWDSNETDGQGSRTFNGTTQYFLAASADANVQAAAIGNWTVSAWIRPDNVTGIKTILSVVGNDGSEASAENALMMVGMNGSSLFHFWEYGAGTDHGDTGAGGLAAAQTFFVAFVKGDDKANPGKKTMTTYVYSKLDLDSGVLNPTVQVDDNITNSDGGTNAVVMIGGHGSATAAWLMDGRISDIRWDTNPLEQPEIEDIIAGYYRSWDEAALETSKVWGAWWKILVKDSDGVFRDLSKLEHITENFLIEFDMTADVDSKPQQLRFRVARGRDSWSTAPLDENSAINKDSVAAYTDLLGVMREVWLKVCRCPLDYTPTDVDYTTLFHGFTDDWQGSDSGDSISFACRDRWAILQDTQIRPESASVDQRTYDNDDYAEDVIQNIIDDNDRAYVWKLKAKPVLFYTGTGTLFVVNPYNQLLEPVASAIEALVVHTGYDVRYVYYPGMYTWRLTVQEPDRTVSTADHTFAAGDFGSFEQVAQSLQLYRNVIEIQYQPDTGTAGADGEIPRAVETATASSAELARYGEWYMRAANLPYLAKSASAAGLGAAILSDLRVPALSVTAVRPFWPNVQLNDYYDFGACVWWSTATKAAVRTYSHVGAADGSLMTTIRAEGQPKAMKFQWFGIAVYPGIADNVPLKAPPATPGPVCAAAPGGVTVTWPRILRTDPVNRDYDHTDVFVSTSTPVGLTAGNLAVSTAANYATIIGLQVGLTYYVRLVHVDVFGGRSAGSAECNSIPTAGTLESDYFHAYSNADQTGLTANTQPNMTTEISDTGADFDLTADEFTAGRDGWWLITAQADLRNANNEWARLEVDRAGGGFNVLADGPKGTGTFKSVASTMVYLDSGDKVRVMVMRGAGTFDILGSSGAQDGTYIKGIELGYPPIP